MTLNEAARSLAEVLRAENDALAAQDLVAAGLLLPAKEAAIAGLRAVLPGGSPDPALAAELRDVAAENSARLLQAIEVQGRILELVARAARQATAGAVHYGARGAATALREAVALTLRA